ncbi:MAG: hypothetical protein M1113_01280 [Candidatus Thermoplasmatota archaeon]|nr:hypothetical protein [Candidatus Thermoplasmatota archaeon]
MMEIRRRFILPFDLPDIFQVILIIHEKKKEKERSDSFPNQGKTRLPVFIVSNVNSYKELSRFIHYR